VGVGNYGSHIIECMPSDNTQCENDHTRNRIKAIEMSLSHAKRALKDQSEVSHHLLVFARKTFELQHLRESSCGCKSALINICVVAPAGDVYLWTVWGARAY
jgi:hypothetical protein